MSLPKIEKYKWKVVPWPKAQEMIDYLMSKGLTKKQAKLADWSKYVSEVQKNTRNTREVKR